MYIPASYVGYVKTPLNVTVTQHELFTQSLNYGHFKTFAWGTVKKTEADSNIIYRFSQG